jgi:hypothetical protein
MFRLNNPDLPLSPSDSSKMGPVCRLWIPSGRGMGSLLKVNTYANWWTNPGWATDLLTPEKPDLLGEYCVVDVGAEVVSARILGYKPVANASEALPDSFWFEGSNIHLYKKNAATQANITVSTTIPFSLSTEYIISVPDDFTVESVSVDGTFSQSGTNLAVNSTGLVAGESIEISGVLIISPVTICAIASFFLDINFLDQVDWLGRSFRPIQDLLKPQILEFTWSQELRLANIFVDFNLLPEWGEATGSGGAIQSIGSITYDR